MLLPTPPPIRSCQGFSRQRHVLRPILTVPVHGEEPEASAVNTLILIGIRLWPQRTSNYHVKSFLRGHQKVTLALASLPLRCTRGALKSSFGSGEKRAPRRRSRATWSSPPAGAAACSSPVGSPQGRSTHRIPAAAFLLFFLRRRKATLTCILEGSGGFPLLK